jgi:hypothetical protein
VVTTAFEGVEVTWPVVVWSLAVVHVPEAVAVFLITPFVRSVLVTVWVAVNVAVWPGARDAVVPVHVAVGVVSFWQSIADRVSDPRGDVNASVTDTWLSAVAPVSFTTKVYLTVAPTLVTVAGVADFTREIAGTGFVVQSAFVDLQEVGGVSVVDGNR